MLSKRISRFLAACVILIGGGISATACVAGDPSDESVGEAEGAVEVGGSCNLFGPFCNEGLTCCKPAWNTPGRCRDLNADVNNCGACGHVCAPGDVCFLGNCY